MVERNAAGPAPTASTAEPPALDTRGLGAVGAMPVHEAALEYVRRGFRVVILHGLTAAGACTCPDPRPNGDPGGARCHGKGKHPRERGWQMHPGATKPAVVSGWFRSSPRSNVGLVMGGPERHVALDLDGPEGRASLEALEAKHGQLPRTLTSRSGRVDGGEHRVFRVPDALDLAAIKNRAGAIAPGVDVRTKGGQIVVSPSVHASGRPYAWIDESPIAELPRWLFDLMAPPPEPARPPAPRVQLDPATMPGQRPAYVEAALREAAAALLSAPKGTRNVIANKEGFSIGGLVGAGVVGEEEAFSLLYAATERGGWDESKRALTRRTLRRALRDGARQPRSLPAPLPPRPRPPAPRPPRDEDVERTAITGEAPEVDEGPVHQQLVDEGPIDQVETPERGPLDGLAARLADGAEHAFDAEVVRAAAELADASPAFQAVLATLAAAKVRIRDWRAAVGQVRDHLKRADEEEHQRRREAEIATDETEMAIAMLRKGLLRDEWDEPRKNLANLIAIFARDPRWSGALAYHVLREGVVITAAPPWNDDERGAPSSGDWTEQASTCATSWLSRAWGIDVASKLVEEAIEAVARRTVLDPLGTYLRGVTWDGTPRIDTWLSAFCRVDDTTYSRAVGARWLISAVARALRPGCQVDCVLILEGLQGKGKSSALRALCPDESLFFDDKLDIGSKDAAQSLRGKWLIELGELSALSRSELSDQKSFITRRVDSYRPSFGRRARDFARRCVFAGSTNEESYLRDEENRRYWPVLCKLGKGGGETIDFEGLAAVRDQLWAEAVDRYRAGERWYADTPELVALCQEQQELRAQADPWEQWIGDWLDVQLKKCEARLLAERCDCVRCRGVTTGAILSGALALEKGRQTRAEEMRAAAVLRRLGWIKGTLASRAGSRVRPYFPALTTSEVVQEVVQ